MRVIPTRIHGVVDYVVGALLIVSPWLFGFADGGAEQWVPIILGIAAIAYSVVTDYELGVTHILPMPLHLILDAGSGVLLAASPWLFGFSDHIWWFHVLYGIGEIAAAMTTRTHPHWDEVAGVPGAARP